jgi:iron complex outermembrane receptor protein
VGCKSILFCGAFAAAGTLVGTGAFAADATATAAATTAATDQAASVGEVTVTARKRSENLQRIPEAVSALSMRQMDQQAIRDVADIQRTVPSLTIDRTSATTSTGMIVSIRGQVASDSLLTISQPVGLYENDVNIPHPPGTNIALFDLDRVEVLKGPQGTLYGRNTTGGAINIVTRAPDYNGLHGYLLGEVGNFYDWKAGGAVNVPILPDVLTVRLAYQHWNRGGFGRSLVTNQGLGDTRDDNIARATVRFDPTSNFTSQLELEYFHAHRTGNLYQTRLLLNPAQADAEWVLEGRVGGIPPSQVVAQAGNNLFVNYATTNQYDRVGGWHVAWDSTWKITDYLSLRSITGIHQFTDFQSNALGSTTIQDFGEGVGIIGGGKPDVAGLELRPVIPDQESLQWSQEFDLSGHLLNDHINWLLGGFISKDSGHENQTASVYPGLIDAMGPLGGFDVSFFDPRETSSTWAIFTQNDIKINDLFSITAGWRYTEEKLTSDSSFALHFLTPNLFDCQAGPNAGTLNTDQYACVTGESAKSSGNSYLLSFNFQLTRNTLFYLKTARGFRGGALQERAPGTPAAKPETDVDYEIGLKTQALEGRLRANMAVYETFYKNKQETAILTLPSGAIFTPIVNAAAAHIKGFEGEFTAIPIDGFSLNANITYIDGIFTGYYNALTPWGAVLPTQVTGTSFVIPKWSLDFGATYTHPVGPGDLTFAANYQWTSKIPTTPFNDDPSLPRDLQNYWRTPVGLLNATLSYHLPDQGLTFTLFATNLTDVHWQRLSLTLAPFGYPGVTEAPRMYGLTIRKSFGSGD